MTTIRLNPCLPIDGYPDVSRNRKWILRVNTHELLLSVDYAPDATVGDDNLRAMRLVAVKLSATNETADCAFCGGTYWTGNPDNRRGMHGDCADENDRLEAEFDRGRQAWLRKVSDGGL